jgi:hypothetical protein
MTTLYPMAGCKFFIGGVLDPKAADFVVGDFSGQTWVEVDGYETAGPLGDTAALVTTPLINRNRDVKQKGTANGGSRQDNFGLLSTDAGQIAMIAAAAPTNRNNYAFKTELNDAVGAGAPSKRYWIGLVMTAVESGGGANTIHMLNTTTEVNSNLVRVAAT